MTEAVSGYETLILTELNSARAELFDLLTPAERRTNRHNGSAYPQTFEDKAMAIIDAKVAGRSLDLFVALQWFRHCLNDVLQYVLRLQIHRTHARTWVLRRGHDITAGCTTMDDAEAEAIFTIRHALAKTCPDRARLYSWCYTVVTRALDTWWARQTCPVELPQKVADSPDRPQRTSIEAVLHTYETHDEETEE